MIIIQKHKIPTSSPKMRLLDYALAVFKTIPSRSSMKKTIKRGALLVNDEVGHSSSWIVDGQVLTLVDLEKKPPKPLAMDLEVVFEDQHIAVINKPPGIEVSGNKYFTIQNALLTNIQPSLEPDALKWARPVHRLDMPTSGLLLIGKTASALMKLGQMLENHEITKKYRAIVAGNVGDFGEICTPINIQESKTSYYCINRFRSLKTKWLSLMELTPHTGRTHQLRIHMASIGFPIVGDKQYGEGPILVGKGLFLAAVELSFTHPYTNEHITVTINQPKKFDSLIKREEARWLKYMNHK